MSDDTGWKPIHTSGGIIDTRHDEVVGAEGVVEMATTAEPHPCMLCRAFEKDERRLVNHLIASGLRPEPDGTFETPIAKDFKGRNSLKIHPASWGFCRKHTHPVDMMATCPDFQVVRTASELASRIK